MILFQFAVASIVDANTGYGLVQSAGKPDIDAAQRRGLEIQARSITALINIVKQRLVQAIASYREAARQRRELSRLANLSDRMLSDIGLFRGDVIAAQLGQVKPAQLNSERRGNRPQQVLELAATRRMGKQPNERAAINEAAYTGAKCA